MEFEGIKVDAAALAEFAAQLSKEMDESEKTIYRLAGTTFNLNSPRQLGQILFDLLKIGDAPKKTKTGQYVDRRANAGRAGGGPRDRPAPARIPHRLQAQIHLRRRLARGDLAQDRPRPHHLQPGDDHHRAAQLAEPEPAEHPHPHRARAGNPQGVRPARRRVSAAIGGLLADRAAHHRRAQPRDGHAGGLQGRRGHPHGDRGPGLRRLPRPGRRRRCGARRRW